MFRFMVEFFSFWNFRNNRVWILLGFFANSSGLVDLAAGQSLESFHLYMGVSENSGFSLQIIHLFIGFSMFLPSILGYPYFWKHPYRSGLVHILWRKMFPRGQICRSKVVVSHQPIWTHDARHMIDHETPQGIGMKFCLKNVGAKKAMGESGVYFPKFQINFRISVRSLAWVKIQPSNWLNVSTLKNGYITAKLIWQWKKQPWMKMSLLFKKIG